MLTPAPACAPPSLRLGHGAAGGAREAKGKVCGCFRSPQGADHAARAAFAARL